MKLSCVELNADGIPLYHTGPALDHGPLPSLFYFSLSGPDSLTLDPYNQPVQFLQGQMIRVFSLTLPGHENGLPAANAMTLWAESFSRGNDPIAPFLDSAQTAIDFAIREKFADPKKMAIGGLSRGGFIAAHLAARDEKFRFLLGFAPMTKLGAIKEFKDLAHEKPVTDYDLLHLTKHLQNRHTRLYIGASDTRVGTENCAAFAEAIAKEKQGAQVELFIAPSIGLGGHGTSPETFKAGASWIATCLNR